MSSPEMAHAPANEALANPIAHVYSRCLAEVEQGMIAVQEEIRAGKLANYDGHVISRLLLGNAEEAAKAGNQQQVEAYVDTLFRLPDADKTAQAKACFAGIKIGSQRAFDVLRGALEAEKIEAQRKTIAFKQGHSPPPTVGLLKGVVSACQENNTPPNSWIGEYALDKEWQWKLYAQYHTHLAKADAPDAAAHQAQLEAKAAELLNTDAYPPDFVYEMIEATLETVKDPSLRQSLVQRFIQASSEILFTYDKFGKLIGVGSSVLQDPALANREAVDFFEGTIAFCAEAFQEQGVDSFFLTRDQLPWKTSLKKYYKATPQELIDTLDFQASQLLSYDIPDASQGTIDSALRNRDFAAMLRDGHLEACAKYYADQGDFSAARLFVSNIASEWKQRAALKRCLERATTANHMVDIRPDDMTLAFNPKLDLAFRFTEARLAKDLPALKEIALECARTINDGNSYHEEEYIQTVYEILAAQDPQQALGAAREILDTLRGADIIYGHVSYLSDALIRAGDTDEPEKAYKHIDHASLTPSYRLLDMWRLAMQLRHLSAAGGLGLERQQT